MKSAYIENRPLTADFFTPVLNRKNSLLKLA